MLKDAYITTFEKDIICLLKKGVSMENISKKYEMPLEELQEVHTVAMEKVEMLIGEDHDINIDYRFVCRDIENFIDRMGMRNVNKENLELFRIALGLAQREPKMLQHMMTEFYPELAAATSYSIHSVQLRLKNIYLHSQRLKHCESKMFFKQYGLERHHGTRLSVLLMSTIECINYDMYMDMNSFEDSKWA